MAFGKRDENVIMCAFEQFSLELCEGEKAHFMVILFKRVFSHTTLERVPFMFFWWLGDAAAPMYLLFIFDKD